MNFEPGSLAGYADQGGSDILPLAISGLAPVLSIA